MKKLLILSLMFLIQFCIKAQERITNNHFFLNPYVYNPAYAGNDGRANVSLNHRQQWRGIEGAPVTSMVTFDMPLHNQLNFGLKIINDSKSILRSTTAFLTLGYTNKFNKDGLHNISFGLSAGALKQSIKTDESIDFNDPQIIGLFNNKTHFLSEFGVHYKNYNLNVGISLPVLLNPGYSSGDIGFSPLNEILFLGSYGLHLSGKDLIFEPHLLYRIRQNLPAQYEASGILHLYKVVWIGGAYRQNYGASALAGLNVGQNVKIGYAYEFAVAQSNTFAGGSHEFQLLLGLGDRDKKARPKNPRFRYKELKF